MTMLLAFVLVFVIPVALVLIGGIFGVKIRPVPYNHDSYEDYIGQPTVEESVLERYLLVDPENNKVYTTQYHSNTDAGGIFHIETMQERHGMIVIDLVTEQAYYYKKDPKQPGFYMTQITNIDEDIEDQVDPANLNDNA